MRHIGRDDTWRYATYEPGRGPSLRNQKRSVPIKVDVMTQTSLENFCCGDLLHGRPVAWPSHRARGPTGIGDVIDPIFDPVRAGWSANGSTRACGSEVAAGPTRRTPASSMERPRCSAIDEVLRDARDFSGNCVAGMSEGVRPRPRPRKTGRDVRVAAAPRMVTCSSGTRKKRKALRARPSPIATRRRRRRRDLRQRWASFPSCSAMPGAARRRRRRARPHHAAPTRLHDMRDDRTS